MKKNLMTYAAGRLVLTIFFCCAMTTTVFTACGGDGDNSTTPEEHSGNTPAYVEMTFYMWGTQDMLDITDMTVTYNDGTGDKTETVTTVDWVKTVKAALPVSFKFERKVTLKEGVTLSDDQTYSYINRYYYDYKILSANGTVLNYYESSGKSTKPAPSNVKGSIVNEFITSGRMNISRAFDFYKDGSCPQTAFPDKE